MYLFTRVNTMTGSRLRDGIQFAGEITDYVNGHSDLDVSGHSFVFGRPPGTLAWSCMVENHAQMLGATDALNGDDSYLDRTAKASELFVGSPEDSFREVLHTAGEMDGPPRYTSAVLANCNAERMADVMAWGPEMTDIVNKVSGRPSMFLGDAYGDFGGVAWLTAFDDADSIDAMRAALTADADYLTHMAGSAGMFIPGSGHTSLVQRIG